MNLSEDVLRVLVTDAEHLNKDEMAAVEPQPIQPREERSWDRPPMGEDFGGGGGGRRPPRERLRATRRGLQGNKIYAPCRLRFSILWNC